MCTSIVKPKNKTGLMSVAYVNERHVKLDRDTIVASLHAFISAFPIDTKSAGTKENFPDLPEHLKYIIGKCSENMTQRQRLSVFDLVDKFKDTIMGPAEPDLISLVQISFKYFNFITACRGKRTQRS